MLNDKFYSNIRSMIIPLYGFKGFHHANNSGKDIDEFIGRTSIVDKLKAWLRDSGKKYAGAYLVTGYRGMGKSSFVHKSIQELKEENKKKFGKNPFVKGYCRYIPVTVNVGNELMSAKALLAMICKLSKTSFEEELAHRRLACWNSYLVTFVVALIFAFIIGYKNTIFTLASKWLFNVDNTYAFIGNLLKDFISWVFCFCAIIGVFFSWKIANAILYGMWKVTNWDWCITISQIKKKWNSLIERIDAEMTTSSETSVNTSATGNNSTLGLGVKAEKQLKYPIAEIPEIQELLVNLLDLIRLHKGSGIRFIFVIDELDKISPKDDERSILPEYDTSNIVNGNSTYRSRQRMLASLIANMKYFISSSFAKFIFITGYDMYEATLSDISNREFNIHSIFNGQLNVSSFFRRTESYSGVDSMIEEYLCSLLCQCKETDKGKERKKEKITLKQYSNTIKEAWRNKGIEVGSSKYSEYNGILERRIIFLHCYLTYLVYMSNGSPKKLAMFIEKFVRTKGNIKSKRENTNYNDNIDLHLGIDATCEYYLYFDSRNLMRIGFVNYLVYPMIQNLIDKSNIYNDKLLVSTSFMISNLYKFHKSGFSMRNLEYMPELLDINRVPELRDFIGGIISFLARTHIDVNIINLYKYKFPLRLSEEITFFSKTSEEISYLFNFSHDELLSVKNLYMLQLEHYQKNKQESTAAASLHHMLGDIYMLEEDYEQAIYEFQEALSALSRQKGKNGEALKLEEIEASKILFFIRLSLKLGLAYEKRKTFDTAYLTYENLVCTLLKYVEQFRNAKDTALDYTRFKKSQFENIRIMYLVPLAKLFVLEKMDLGGFTEHDLKQMEEEFDSMTKNLNLKYRNVVFVDYFGKCGDIMFYKNFSDENNLHILWNRVNNGYPYKKHESCEACRKESPALCTPPCSACICYSKSLLTYLNQIGKKTDNIASQNYMTEKSLVLLNTLLTSRNKDKLRANGYTPTMAIANSLVGLGNCMLACAKELRKEQRTGISSIEPIFGLMNNWITLSKGLCDASVSKDNVGEDNVIDIPQALDLKIGTFERAIISYWSAALAFHDIGEYKASYTLYCQILDSVLAYYKSTSTRITSHNVLKFCKSVTEEAIRCTFEHYGHINAAEIDKIKRILDMHILDRINLDEVSNFADIEAVIYRYYQICLSSNEETLRIYVLNKVLNATQLGHDKLICSLTQNIENLQFKAFVNEQVLCMLIPNVKDIYSKGKHRLIDTLKTIAFYLYDERSFKNFFQQVEWNIFDANTDEMSNRLELLMYFVCDTLFCLNKISDLVSPLYCTTLYNNEYIAETYEKGFVWNHLLISLREIFSYVKSEDKDEWMDGLMKRYHYKLDKSEIETVLKDIEALIRKTDVWYDRISKEDVIDVMYNKICPSSHRYLTSSYLIGNALDFYHRAIQMHTSGKAYKEMITTLFFLEDDLRNDSCYLNFATEMFLLNTGYIQDRIKILEKYYLKSKELFEIENYIN